MHGLRNVINRVVASFSNCSFKGETKEFISQAGPRPESFGGLDSDINIQGGRLPLITQSTCVPLEAL